MGRSELYRCILIPRTALLKLLEKENILQISGFHAHCLFRVVQSRDGISNTVIGVGAEEKPFPVPYIAGDCIQQAQGFLKLAAVDGIDDRSILLAPRISLIAVLISAGLVTAVTILRTVLGWVGLPSLNRVISSIDFIHFPGGLFISGIQVRMVFFRQLSVCGFDLVLRRISGHA